MNLREMIKDILTMNTF